MTTSARPTHDPWSSGDPTVSSPWATRDSADDPAPSGDDQEVALLVEEPVPQNLVPQQPAVPTYEAATAEQESGDHAPRQQMSGSAGDAAPTADPTVHPGISGRGVVVLTTAATSGVVLLDFALTGGLTFFFDLSFVVVCLVAAMAAQRHDLFTPGVAPPLVFAAVISAVAVVAPTTFASDVGLSTTLLTGLATHAGALVAGYGLSLLAVGMRVLARRTAGPH